MRAHSLSVARLLCCLVRFNNRNLEIYTQNPDTISKLYTQIPSQRPASTHCTCTYVRTYIHTYIHIYVPPPITRSFNSALRKKHILHLLSGGRILSLVLFHLELFLSGCVCPLSGMDSRFCFELRFWGSRGYVCNVNGDFFFSLTWILVLVRLIRCTCCNVLVVVRSLPQSWIRHTKETSPHCSCLILLVFNSLNMWQITLFISMPSCACYI